MLIAFDVGNTDTTIGVFGGDQLLAQWRYTTCLPHELSTDLSTNDSLGPLRTADDHADALRQLFTEADATLHITDAVVASVVSTVAELLSVAVQRVFNVTPLIITATSPLPIELRVDEPTKVGVDRVLNSFAAYQLYRSDAICVDMGTATTFDCVTDEGVFFGGVIMPGVHTAAASLSRYVPRLRGVELRAPGHVIGTNTDDCIRSGVLLGAADAIDGMIMRIKAEWPGAHVPQVIATGGVAAQMSALCKRFDCVEPMLTLVALNLAYKLLAKH